jgi:hypothetical protein
MQNLFLGKRKKMNDAALAAATRNLLQTRISHFSKEADCNRGYRSMRNQVNDHSAAFAFILFFPFVA